jgi:hypothetical protein
MWESGRSAQGIFKLGVGRVVHEKAGAAWAEDSWC